MIDKLDKGKAEKFAEYLLEPYDGGMQDARRVNLDKVWFKTFAYPPSIRMMAMAGEEPVEVVLKVPGILCSKMLPPLKRLPSANTSKHNMLKLKQYVKVTGYGEANFNDASSHILKLLATFQRHVAPAEVHDFRTIPFEGHPCLESHARYFSDRDTVPHERNESFLPGVDPYNVLRNIQPDCFIHAEDNRVEYCLQQTGENGVKRIIPCDPGTFQTGDIVEMLFSFVAVPVKDRKHKVLLSLRGLTLLNSELRKEAQASMNEGSQPIIAVETAPKRRRLYLHQDDRMRTAPGGVSITTGRLGTEDVTPEDQDLENGRKDHGKQDTCRIKFDQVNISATTM
ncbi:hypothetical protein EST38_g14077 [Candolleomyces aberdarensis]|uniref:Uncharacterized protein n=1 Tax=Candolleomyces aberdarensis TaxID=2316362 RepID=A0A4V1Q1J2_9AGAR|nr:hypothetical protein EST38_g14077 [Candolleomyces aberdarensis]